MSIVSSVFIIFTALEFFFIFYLETIATASEKTAKTFQMETEELKRKSVNVLFKNAGGGIAIVAFLLTLFVGI